MCNRKRVRIVWGFMESLCFSGLASGWYVLTYILQQEGIIVVVRWPDPCDTWSADLNGTSGALARSDYSPPAAAATALQPAPPTWNPRNCTDTAGTGSGIGTGTDARSSEVNTSRLVADRTIAGESAVFGAGGVVQCLPLATAGNVSGAGVVQLEALLPVVITAMLLLPVGLLFDNCGTLRTRILATASFISATLILTFTTQSSWWLIFPAWTALKTSGLLVLLTNLQLANLTERWRATVLLMYHAACETSPVVVILIKMSAISMTVQTAFMFLTIAIVPLLIGTIAFLPRSRLQWPVPDNYRESPDTLHKYFAERTRNRLGVRRQGRRTLFWQQLKRPLTALQTAWFCSLWLVLRLCRNAWLQPHRALPVSPQTDAMEEQMVLMTPLLLLICPLFGVLLDWRNADDSLGACGRFASRLCLVYLVVWVLTVCGVGLLWLPPGLLDPQYPVLLVTVTETLVWGSHAVATATLFPFALFGTLYLGSLGIAELIACLASVAHDCLHGSLTSPHGLPVFLIILVVPTVGHVAFLWRKRNHDDLMVQDTTTLAPAQPGGQGRTRLRSDGDAREVAV